MIESTAQMPAIRVTQSCRCPVCDGAMPAGVWAVQIGGDLVCSAQCFNSREQSLSYEARPNEEAIDKLEGEITDLEDDIEASRDEIDTCNDYIRKKRSQITALQTAEEKIR